MKKKFCILILFFFLFIILFSNKKLFAFSKIGWRIQDKEIQKSKIWNDKNYLLKDVLFFLIKDFTKSKFSSFLNEFQIKYGNIKIIKFSNLLIKKNVLKKKMKLFFYLSNNIKIHSVVLNNFFKKNFFTSLKKDNFKLLELKKKIDRSSFVFDLSDFEFNVKILSDDFVFKKKELITKSNCRKKKFMIINNKKNQFVYKNEKDEHFDAVLAGKVNVNYIGVFFNSSFVFSLKFKKYHKKKKSKEDFLKLEWENIIPIKKINNFIYIKNSENWTLNLVSRMSYNSSLSSLNFLKDKIKNFWKNSSLFLKNREIISFIGSSMRKGVNKKIYIGALLEYSFFEKELKKEFKYGIKVGGNYYFLIKSMNINIESFFKILKSIDMFKVKKYSHFRYNFLYKTKIKFFKFGNFFVSLIGNFSSGNKFSISNKNIKKGNKFFLGISFMYNNYFYFKI